MNTYVVITGFYYARFFNAHNKKAAVESRFTTLVK